MNKQTLQQGIAAYMYEQNVLLRLLKKRGSFTEHEFDSWFRHREGKSPRLMAGAITGDTFILGEGINGGCLWAEMLELLQIMVMRGMVEMRVVNSGKSDTVIYLPASNFNVHHQPHKEPT